jgi:hypothetical protein
MNRPVLPLQGVDLSPETVAAAFAAVTLMLLLIITAVAVRAAGRAARAAAVQARQSEALEGSQAETAGRLQALGDGRRRQAELARVVTERLDAVSTPARPCHG